MKRIRWGGRRLGTVLNKPIGPESDFAESWEIVDHGDDQSRVQQGPYAGQTLSQLVQEQNLPLLGRHAGRRQFPLLVKFLDANDTLSVQVHPDDAQAEQFDPDENGKTEAWVILDADPESRLYVGFRDGVTETDVRTATAAGEIEGLLHVVDARPGDVLFVPAGTVHAIGSGVMLAEIQQSSDLTFRLHDWGRLDADGRPRELHVEQALQCLDFDRGPVHPIVPRPIAADHHLEELVRCDQFVMLRRRSSTPFSIGRDDACHVLTVLDGSAVLTSGGVDLSLSLGQTVLLPARRSETTLIPQGELVLLDAALP